MIMNQITLAAVVVALCACGIIAKPFSEKNLHDMSKDRLRESLEVTGRSTSPPPRDCVYEMPLHNCDLIWCREACKRHRLPNPLQDYECCTMDCLKGEYPRVGEKGDAKGHDMRVKDAYCRFGQWLSPPADLQEQKCCADYQTAPFLFLQK